MKLRQIVPLVEYPDDHIASGDSSIPGQWSLIDNESEGERSHQELLPVVHEEQQSDEDVCPVEEPSVSEFGIGQVSSSLSEMVHPNHHRHLHFLLLHRKEHRGC